MGNLCAIFHQRFRQLIHLLPNTRQAQLLDYILLGWQTSTYRLKDSNKVWFMKPYDDIIEETGIPRSTLNKYIRSFISLGFLERRHALYSRTVDTGFMVKKGTYLSVTDKLLTLLAPKKDNQDPVEKTHPSPDVAPPVVVDNEAICSEINKNERTGSLKTSESYISDDYIHLTNNISQKYLASVDKTHHNNLFHQFHRIQTFLYETLKEEVPIEVKKTVAGIFFNLTFQHKVFFTLPEQCVAEYLYALRNVDYHLPTIQCFKHRNNVLAKLMRKNLWRTPKGFHNHDDWGETFKHVNEGLVQAWEEKKTDELKTSMPLCLTDPTNAELSWVEKELVAVDERINTVREELYSYDCEHDIVLAREKIDALREKRRDLESKYWELQKALEPMDDCAGWS
ncbi:MAG: hypothetical protein H2069_10210 [Legionella sp.]|nr:hypothetical protein [Legionella sp.]